MAESDNIILGRMRRAGVPAHLYNTTLALEKQNVLAAAIGQKKYDLGEGLLQSYIIEPANNPKKPSPARVCGLIARELVLARKPTTYVTLPQLTLIADRAAEDEINLGVGYLVVGDFNDLVAEWKRAEWALVESMLVSHLYRGGGLILGNTGGFQTPVLSEEFDQAMSGATRILVE